MTTSKAAPHPSGSRVPVAPIFSGELLQHFVPDMIKRDICKETKQKKHNRAYSIQHSHLAEMNGSSFTPPDQTACSAQSTSSLPVAG